MNPHLKHSKRERTKVLTVTIKDCTVQTFRAGGKGGQNQNKTDSGVRIIHPPSGARGESRDERSQLLNKRKAFVKMGQSAEFRRWVDLQHARIAGDIDRQVQDDMRPQNLTVEYFTPDGSVGR